jgi:hypothetical protein
VTLGTAAVCLRGHVATVYSEYEAFGYVPDRCGTCGAQIITTCPACSTGIAGVFLADLGPRYEMKIDISALERSYEVPNFWIARDCGAALPWADRTARIWELENRLRDNVLEEHDRLILREQLQALMNPDIADEEASRRWRRVREIGGKAFGRAMTDVALPLLDAKLKQDLGL